MEFLLRYCVVLGGGCGDGGSGGDGGEYDIGGGGECGGGVGGFGVACCFGGDSYYLGSSGDCCAQLN